MVGPVLGGILIAAQGPDLAYWLNAATFLALGRAARAHPGRRLQAGKVESRGHWRDIGDGIQVVFQSRPLLAVLVVWNVVMLGNAAINVAEVVLAKVALDERQRRLRRPRRAPAVSASRSAASRRGAPSAGSASGASTRSGSC